jgi:hypothetical protein
MFDLAKKRIHEMRTGRRAIDFFRTACRVAQIKDPVPVISGLLNNCIACTIFCGNVIFAGSSWLSLSKG